MPSHARISSPSPQRRNRLLQESRHDSYRARGKPAGPTVCTGCGAAFQDGRWRWLESQEVPPHARGETCPACQRCADDLPAGFCYLSGPFLGAHRDEISRLLANTAARESENHPLERLMALTPVEGGLLATTTGVHLARRLGEALHRSFQGSLDLHYNEQEMLLRVYWRR